MSGETPTKLAVVGCGAVAERYHLPAVEASERVELVALVDPSSSRAAALAERYGAQAFADASSLPGLVEAAIVATPNHLHASVAGELLRSGIHCLIEKPVATTTRECDELAEAARDGGAVVAVGHDFRLFPVAGYAKALFASGALGAVEHVDVRQSAGGRWPYASTYVFDRERAGGGVLLDFGVHVLDLLLWWLGDARVASYRDDAAGGVETECECELELAGGGTVTLELTRLRHMRDTTVVRCAQATVEVAVFEPSFVRLAVGTSRTLHGDVVDDEFAGTPLRTVFRRQLEGFVDAIEKAGRPLVSLDEGRRVVELVEACYAARRPLRRAWDWPEATAAIGGGG
jgi:predicted dehydrogenase